MKTNKSFIKELYNLLMRSANLEWSQLIQQLEKDGISPEEANKESVVM